MDVAWLWVIVLLAVPLLGGWAMAQMHFWFVGRTMLPSCCACGTAVRRRDVQVSYFAEPRRVYHFECARYLPVQADVG